LKPIYRNDAIFERLLRVLSEDVEPDVVDAAYAALLRLAVAPEAEHDMESYLNASRGSREPSISLSSPGTGMPPLPSSLILHLSDLHFGTRQDATSWYNQLAEDLTQELRVSRLDAVILSGDIANRSTPEEYDAAQHFFDILAREFHVSAPQIILVPGNHDLNWGLAKKAYKLMDREEHKGELKDGHFIPAGEDAIRVRDEDLYKQRFAHFAEFYKAVRGEAYPLEYPEQAILYPIPAANLLILGLNSAWELDHHFSKRAGIHREALNAALTKLRMSPDDIKNCLKIAVWHHPIHSGAEDRITEGSFLEQLAKAEFRLALHGHVHKADANIFTYDKSPAGRRLDIVCAGTFGAPVREWVPGYPLQYNLLRFEGNTLTVETRRREEPNGAWKPDARWLRGPGQDPAPRYSVELFASA
jgi:predicted MPP superfamily phosphohydrolase